MKKVRITPRKSSILLGYLRELSVVSGDHRQSSEIVGNDRESSENGGKRLDILKKQCWLLSSRFCFFLDKIYCFSEFFTVSVKMPKILLFYVTERKD